MKSLTDTQPIIVTVPEATISRYLDANRAVEQIFGASPGPEFLMSLAVEHEDTSELIDLYCGEIVHALRQTTAAIH